MLFRVLLRQLQAATLRANGMAVTLLEALMALTSAAKQKQYRARLREGLDVAENAPQPDRVGRPVAAEVDWESWFRNKDLTKNLLGNKLTRWFKPLAPWRERECNVLEVGSYEGRSAIALLEYLPHCRLTAIDIFAHPDIERRFDSNMTYYGDRVTKIKDRAIPAMERLLKERRSFNIIYLDTGKRRAISFANSALAWPLLSKGGIMIWDDLLWGRDKVDSSRPGPGIRLFTNLFSECIEVLHDRRQLIVRKTGNWPRISQS